MRSASPAFVLIRTCSGALNWITAMLLISSQHTAGVANLPDHHKDPFDRAD